MAKVTRRVQLARIHEQTATMTDFAGFEMPLFYEGIIPEHLAVRNSAGVFDISHMGRVVISGGDAERLLNYVITNDVSKLASNNALYSVMCTENGGIIDDFIVYRLEAGKFIVVFNAGNRQKDYGWMVRCSKGYNVTIQEISDDVAMFAVQGPKAAETLQTISNMDLSKIERFKCTSANLGGIDVFLARTGYTGEDGFEIFVWAASLEKPENAISLWSKIQNSGRTFGIKPCGLGARDTLRLEAGLCLYGNDIDENTTPLEAGLGFVVKLQKDSFIGKDALQKQKSEGIKRKKIGLVMIDQGIPRANYEIYDGKERVGHLTSGTFSPLLRVGIGMGYIDSTQALEGNIVQVKIRDKLAEARIASFPLYSPNEYGYKRKATH